MAEGISLPPGAFAASKSGAPQPAPVTPVAPKEASPAPETKLRKATPAPKSEPKTESIREIDGRGVEKPENMTAAERKIWKFKDGDEEFEFDATDEEAVKLEVQKARAANKRFDQAAAEKREAVKARQEAQEAFAMLKDPQTLRQILSDPRVGIDVKKFAEELVWEQIQESQLTPEQKAQRDKDRKLADFEAKEAKAREENLTKAQREAQTRFETSYEQKITRALDLGGIPQTPEAVSRMADLLYQAVDKGYDLSPEDLVSQVRQDLMTDITAVLGAADGDQILALLGEANAKKLREADLKRLKNPQGNPFPVRSQQKTAASGKAPELPRRIAGSDWKQSVVNDFLNRKR